MELVEDPHSPIVQRPVDGRFGFLCRPQLRLEPRWGTSMMGPSAGNDRLAQHGREFPETDRPGTSFVCFDLPETLASLGRKVGIPASHSGRKW